MALAQEIESAIVPFSTDLLAQLKTSDRLSVTQLPATGPTLIHAQSKQVRERVPNELDTNWNAHLWYVEKTPSIQSVTIDGAVEVAGGVNKTGVVTLTSWAPDQGTNVVVESSSPDVVFDN